MFYVYVLESLSNKKRYVGSTGKIPEERCKEHNSGANQWTKGNRPFKLVYQESFESNSEARKREIFLKSGAGRKLLTEILK